MVTYISPELKKKKIKPKPKEKQGLHDVETKWFQFILKVPTPIDMLKLVGLYTHINSQTN